MDNIVGDKLLTLKYSVSHFYFSLWRKILKSFMVLSLRLIISIK